MITLAGNRHQNLRELREGMNEIAANGFIKSKNRGLNVAIRCDQHVIDDIKDRDFPIKEFVNVIIALATKSENHILDIYDRMLSGELDTGIRINCMSHGNYLVGVTMKIYQETNTYHISVRTVYRERNMLHRDRSVPVERIWTLGIPTWAKPYFESKETN